MARPASGNIETVPLADGTVSVRARFRHRGERCRVVLGRDVDGWTEARGRRELTTILVQLSAGIPIEQVLARYEPEPTHDDEYAAGVTLHEYASDWLERRRVGEIGEGPLAETTYEDYLWRLKKYILPSFGRTPVARISDVDCRRFRGKLFADSEALRKIAAAGGRAEDEHGRRRRPLSPRSIQMMMRLLGQILAQAVRDKVREDNPARDPELKIRVPKPARTFLEIDQLVMLLDAAHSLQTAPRSSKRAKLTRGQAAEIRTRLAHGETQYALRLEYGLSAGSMSMLAQGKTYSATNDRIGWRALCAMLGYAGPRIAETLDILERDVRDVRLHDPDGARLWIADSKTPTGVRHVEITPSLRDELLAYRADKVRHGYPTGPDTPFFCTRSGKRWDAGNVRERILEPAVNLANERLTERGLPPLPHVTPHTLRRIYVSIMLLATNFDVTYVQHQVGHAESRTTLDVYAQLLDRRKREHGVAFDALLTDARSTLYGPQQEGFGPPFGLPNPDTPDRASEPPEQSSSFAATSKTRPGRFERPTSRSGGERSIH
jgi:integrase